MRYVSPIRRADLRERARTVCTVASAAFMVSMAVAGAAFAVFMMKLVDHL